MKRDNFVCADASLCLCVCVGGCISGSYRHDESRTQVFTG
jgi:hypothetical protein